MVELNTDSQILWRGSENPQLWLERGEAAVQLTAPGARLTLHTDHLVDALEVGPAEASALLDLYKRTEAAHLRKPVHHVLGNHDCMGVFANSGVAPETPGYGKAFFTQAFGARYYAFDHKDVHFVVLDSVGLTADRNYEGRIDAEQIAWLEADLAACPQGQRIIVAMHIPLLSAMPCYEPLDWLDTPHNWTYVVNAREVIRLLQRHNVLAVLAGHSHSFEQTSLNGIAYITSGAVAGNDWHGSFLGTPEGYTELAVRGTRVEARYRTYGFKSPSPRDVAI